MLFEHRKSIERKLENEKKTNEKLRLQIAELEEEVEKLEQDNKLLERDNQDIEWYYFSLHQQEKMDSMRRIERSEQTATTEIDIQG